MNLVTGATGLLGSHIVEQLRRRGRPVRVLVRRGAERGWLETQGVEFADGDLTDVKSLATACQGVTTVYHAAARVGDWGPWPDFVRISIDGTRHLIDAAIAAGVKRFVHISSISAYGHRNGEGQVFDETAPLGMNLYKWSYYTRAKVEAEHIVWDRHKKGQIEVTVIRPSWIYGPRDRTSIARIMNLVRTRKAKLLGDGTNRLNTVYAGNVAECCILAADSPQAAGEGYNASDDGVITQKQMYDLIAKALGEPPVTKTAPYAIAYRFAFFLECLGHLFRAKKPPMITRYSVWLMGRRSFFKADKARTQLGWKPSVTYDVGVPMTVKWMLEKERGAGVEADVQATAQTPSLATAG
jgi:nucleoside-diphosphate-sugar epimerase